MAFSQANVFSELLSPISISAAWRDYSVALAITKKALCCPQKVTDDRTLIAVMLLALFEKKTKGYQDWDDDKIQAEKRHIDGAIAIAKLRGSAQFDNPISRSVFASLDSIVVTSCKERGCDVPTDFRELQAQAYAIARRNEIYPSQLR
jgi:hypothetical protein